MYLDAGQDGFINHVQQELDKLVLPNKIELANKICLAKKSYLVYDNANNRLFYYDDWYARIVDIQPNDFKGKKLIDFVPCMGGYYNQVIIVEIPGGTPEIILANPPYLSGSPVSTEGTGINSDSKFLGSAKIPIYIIPWEIKFSCIIFIATEISNLPDIQSEKQEMLSNQWYSILTRINSTWAGNQLMGENTKATSLVSSLAEAVNPGKKKALQEKS